METILSNVALGLSSALTAETLFYCFVGVFLGTLLGVIPGIGTLISLSLLFPFTFHLSPTAGIVMLAGIYYGTTYGGSIASVLLGLPGTPANVATVADGHAMAKSGRAGVALLLTAVASFIGGSVGILLMMFAAPPIAKLGLSFSAPEYFSLMLLGLVAASTMSTGSAAKSLAMVALGILLGLVGLDTNSGLARMTFSYTELADGISLVVLAMGLFGIAEITGSINRLGRNAVSQGPISYRSMIPSRTDWKTAAAPIARGSAIGSFFGTLPGTGGLIAAFMSYMVETRVSKHPERFGKGALQGVVGPESANNAADQTAFIPTLTLGIPGSASMAIILGVLIIHGITPGPLLITEHPDLFWGLIMSFWIGNVMLLVLNIPLVGLWIRVLKIPYNYLYPSVLAFCCLGVFSINSSNFEVWLMILFGISGYVMRTLDMPAAPLILGFVLGPLMETHFRRSLLISRGDFSIFVERPISAALLGIVVLMLVMAIFGPRLSRMAKARAARRAPASPTSGS